MGKYNVTASGETPVKLTVKARQFEIIIDEPPKLGGTDTGPNPVEYLLSAICGCMYIVGFVIAREMGFVLRSLNVEAEGEILPGGFSGTNPEIRPGFQSISVKLLPETDADESVLENWLSQVEKRCPVSDNLANTTPVHVSVEK